MDHCGYARLLGDGIGLRQVMQSGLLWLGVELGECRHRSEGDIGCDNILRIHRARVRAKTGCAASQKPQGLGDQAIHHRRSATARARVVI